ncbi:DUF4234 domain-containing protein [Geodermatophilus sp. SYSU D00684]
MTTSPFPGAHAQQAGYAATPYSPYGQAPFGHAPAFPGYTGQPMPPVPAGAQYPQSGPIGKVRSTGIAILLLIVTFGIYSLVWFYCVHDEMKRHTGQGLGGGLALVIAIFFGIASPYVVSSEVGNLYARMGRAKPVSGATGLWYFPGIFLVVGPIVWFVKTNGALNAYWRSLGAA